MKAYLISTDCIVDCHWRFIDNYFDCRNGYFHSLNGIGYFGLTTYNKKTAYTFQA